MEALYVAHPTYFPDEFGECSSGGHAMRILWLVPISRPEAQYVRDRGWSAFEDQLVERQPDLTDLLRPTMPL